MARVKRTTKLQIDLGPRDKGGANTGKREHLELTRNVLNGVREFYTAFFLAHPDKLFEKRLYFHRKSGEWREGLISREELLTWAEFQTVPTAAHPEPLPEWSFGAKFPGVPVIYRRSVIRDAIGRARSYLTRLRQWEDSGGGKGRPGLPAARNHPVLYGGALRLETEGLDRRNNFVRILVYDGKTWVWKNYPVRWGRWHSVRLAEDGWQSESPQLVLKPGYAGLHFPQERKVSVLPVKEARKDPGLVTVAVDLNVKNLAVVTVRRYGKIIRTVFVRDRGLDLHRWRHMKVVAKKQWLSGKPVKGERSNKKLWAHVRRTNLDFARRAAAVIAEVCRGCPGCVLIFERLRKIRPKKGESKSRRLNRKLANQLKGLIRDLAKQKVLALGVATVEVNPHGTSRYCPRCGARGERFSLVEGRPVKMRGGKLFRCPKCGYTADADFNASANQHRSFYREFHWAPRKKAAQNALSGYRPDGKSARDGHPDESAPCPHADEHARKVVGL